MYWAVGLCVLGLLWLWHYFKQRNEFFKRLGIDGPEPTLGLGNVVELQGKVPSVVLGEWGRLYGQTYGYMEGGRPVLVSSDPDFLQEVFVKQFSAFHGRKEFPLSPDPDKDKRVNVFGARGARWKRLRTISTPIFTASKMRQMQPFVRASIQELMGLLDAEAEKAHSFDIYPYFQRLTLDVIAKVAFGYETSVQAGANPEFFELVKSIFGKSTFFGNIFSTLSTLFPEAKPLWRAGAITRGFFFPIPFLVLTKRLRRVVNRRKAEKGKDANRLHDFIDMMLELEAEAGSFGEGADIRSVAKALTADEVVSQMMVILIAGYETTSIALAFLAYQLALKKEVQEELYQELLEKIGSEDAVDHDSVAKLNFLDQVINEGLRLYPHGSIVVNRKCMGSGVEVNGIQIPQGLNVAADVWSLHRNTELWGNDADEFRPSRFSKEESEGRHPMAFMPFGAGPRICLGMRFALLEEKLTLARLLLRYEICSTPLTPAEAVLKGNVTFGPEEVQIRLRRRRT